MGFENFYVYSAVNTDDGKHFSLLLPSVDTECMNIFLAELSKNITAKIILIMDGAGWHKSKSLVIPSNIQILLLPPYCPELNPVEKLWRYIKDHTIKNKVFEVLAELEDEVCAFIAELKSDVVKSICGNEVLGN